LIANTPADSGAIGRGGTTGSPAADTRIANAWGGTSAPIPA
jgi:hypothetical protein